MRSLHVLVQHWLFFVFIFCSILLLPAAALGITRHYKLNIKLQNVTRLCHTRAIVSVDGQLPGAPIVAREGDRLVVEVTNHVPNNVTIHWHGIRQLGSAWADGTAYVTQCPIQTGQSYVHNFTVEGQRGTFWYHAHISWLRSTLYGPLIILPKRGVPYPFAKPYEEVPIIFGEWFNSDPEEMIKLALETGSEVTASDAFTINGLPGPLYNCSAKDTFRLEVKPGKTYLLRLINAVMNNELFFSIANHSLMIVDADGVYIKPYKTKTLLISPGQTYNVLLKTKPHSPNAAFYMYARPYISGPGSFDNSTVAGILEYESSTNHSNKTLPVLKPILPLPNDTSFAANFPKKLRSLGSKQFPVSVPKTADRHFLFTLSVGTDPCPKNQTCQGPIKDTKFAASVNNVSYTVPTTALLQAHYSGQSGVYSSDFPVNPMYPFNYTGPVVGNTMVSHGTKVVVIPYNTSVELVIQDANVLGLENHPLHLHGYNFYVVGTGKGNFNPVKDPRRFNLVDPVARNTVGVPRDGWVAVRFLADNPGVWLMHCHVEKHQSWGMVMAWIVLDGDQPNQKLQPPPADLPKC